MLAVNKTVIIQIIKMLNNVFSLKSVLCNKFLHYDVSLISAIISDSSMTKKSHFTGVKHIKHSKKGK